jgi:hypothetical protein
MDGVAASGAVAHKMTFSRGNLQHQIALPADYFFRIVGHRETPADTGNTAADFNRKPL